MLKRLLKREPVEFDAGTKGALRHLAITSLTIVALMVATYSLPIFKRFRPWIPGEAVPLARLFNHYDDSILPAFAEANALAAPESGNGLQKSAASDSKNGTQRAELPAKGRVAPEELDGLTQRIEDPSGVALDSFYAALLRTARAEPKAITRVAHFGDSAVAADSVTYTMRRQLQKRFGDAGHGFVLIAPGDMHYYHLDIAHRASDSWELFQLVLGSLGTNWYGYGGVQYRGADGASARFATVGRGEVGKQVARYEVFYQRYPGGGPLILKLDNERPQTVNTRSKVQEDAWVVVQTSDGSHGLSVRATGSDPVRLYGVALERDVPGVVYDSLGMVGGRAERFLSLDREHIQRQISHRNPALVILAYGGNEADNSWLDIARYEEKLRLVLNHIRVPGENRACLLMAPLDQGERDGRGEIRTIPKLPEIVEAQRRVALSEGCAFYDTFSAMGGKGSMLRWYRKRPRLAMSDFRHATTIGYEVIGEMFYKALLNGYADYIQRQ